MRGQMVIVRAYSNKMSTLRVWDVGEKVVYVASDEQYKLLLKNDPSAIGPVGIPKEDVYCFDPSLISPNQGQNNDWSKMKRYID
jgi:hypothetical protein